VSVSPGHILRVGLTGGIASGKSTIAARLRERGIPVLDADEVVRELYRPGGEGARAVSLEFGPEMLDPSGGVDRARLSRHAFADPLALARLNSRIHPLVIEAQRRWFQEREAEGSRVAVIEATLLVESGGRGRYDLIVAVSAPEEVRLERAVHRSGEIEREGLRRRIAAQMRDADRETAADIVLRTDGTKEELMEKVDALAERIAEMARRQRRSAEGPSTSVR
jgi:dephospho-CoA kinase